MTKGTNITIVKQYTNILQRKIVPIRIILHRNK